MSTTIKIGKRIEVIVPDSKPKGGPVLAHNVSATFDGKPVDYLVGVHFGAEIGDVVNGTFALRLVKPNHDVPSDFVVAAKEEGWRVVAVEYATLDDKERRRWL
jgi:hypothetical protein